MISFSGKGDFGKTRSFIKRALSGDIFAELHRYGKEGVTALSKATPVDSSLTANSWEYRIVGSRTKPGIEWYNTNMAGRTSVAILIQYGHATGTGGYVSGIDYINPAIQPIFDKIADDVWKKVTK